MDSKATQLHISKHDTIGEISASDETKCITAATDIAAEKRFCTRAVTGCVAVFQEIFICRTCRDNNIQQHIDGDDLPLCVCSACADECHADHDIEYVGLGPSFCDCNNFNCGIFSESVEEANRLGFIATNHINQPQTRLITINYPINKHSKHTYVRDVYCIPSLQEKTFQDRLIFQSNELVRHSKDTFWLDSKIIDESMHVQRANLCELEYFAWSIFRQHMKHYFSFNELESHDDRRITGAEWWIQVKPCIQSKEMTLSNTGSITSTHSVSNVPNDSCSVEAIDLHYDKDEEMAISFGIGIFPSISTVTYLTNSLNASPTVIFPRRYDEIDDDVNEGKIADMFISYPNVTKHVVFDGRLLHGAPSHPLLRRQFLQSKDNQKTDDAAFTLNKMSSESATRITFLVNIWIDHKPFGVKKLPDQIRAAIQSPMIDKDVCAYARDGISFTPNSPVREVILMDENDLPDIMRQKIELPFVGEKASGSIDWHDVQEEAEGDSIIIMTYPPPSIPDCDTILVLFGSGLEAKFATG